MASCYRESLKLAMAHGARTVAFPAISCGVYRFPVRRAARIAVDAVRGFLREHPESGIEEVLFVAFDDEVARALEMALAGWR